MTRLQMMRMVENRMRSSPFVRFGKTEDVDEACANGRMGRLYRWTITIPKRARLGCLGADMQHKTKFCKAVSLV